MGRRLTDAQIRALQNFAGAGGHGFGEYAYLPVPVAVALAVRGLVTLGWVPVGHESRSIYWGHATEAGVEALNALRYETEREYAESLASSDVHLAEFEERQGRAADGAKYRASADVRLRKLAEWQPWYVYHAQARYGFRQTEDPENFLRPSRRSTARREMNRARHRAEGDPCETVQTRIWVDKTERRARNELARSSGMSTEQRSAIERIGESAHEALSDFYVSPEDRSACHGRIRPDHAGRRLR